MSNVIENISKIEVIPTYEQGVGLVTTLKYYNLKGEIILEDIHFGGGVYSILLK